MNKQHLKRDPKSGALLNTNREEVIEYKKRLEKEANTEKRLTSLETKMDKILKVMEKIANG
tara:strand:+ start:1249 stop:1431 length:183 start_codon:yes stop_codon:yes gene_type:complete